MWTVAPSSVIRVADTGSDRDTQQKKNTSSRKLLSVLNRRLLVFLLNWTGHLQEPRYRRILHIPGWISQCVPFPLPSSSKVKTRAYAEPTHSLATEHYLWHLASRPGWPKCAQCGDYPNNFCTLRSHTSVRDLVRRTPQVLLPRRIRLRRWEDQVTSPRNARHGHSQSGTSSTGWTQKIFNFILYRFGE